VTTPGDESDPRDVTHSPSGLIRGRLWQAAGILLIGLGILLVAVGLGGLVTSGGGLAYVALAVPPGGLGILVMRRVARARIGAVSVSLAYAAFAASVAVAPYQGLTEPDASNLPGPDAGLVLVGAAFAAAALLLLIGSPVRGSRSAIRPGAD
jgi:hypothetical protein